MKMNSRNISDGDADCIKTLFYEHGINDWNSFDDREINDQISLVNKGLADAVLLEGERILGVAFIVYGVSCPAKLEKYHDLRKISFVKDVVVSSEVHGQGFGTKLLEYCKSLAAQNGYDQVYIERHEENIASRRMMEKSGFKIVDTYHDPVKRKVGSRNTVILSADSQVI